MTRSTRKVCRGPRSRRSSEGDVFYPRTLAHYSRRPSANPPAVAPKMHRKAGMLARRVRVRWRLSHVARASSFRTPAVWTSPMRRRRANILGPQRKWAMLSTAPVKYKPLTSRLWPASPFTTHKTVVVGYVRPIPLSPLRMNAAR